MDIFLDECFNSIRYKEIENCTFIERALQDKAFDIVQETDREKIILFDQAISFDNLIQFELDFIVI